MSQQTERKIIRADPTLRFLTLIAVVAVLMAGIVALVFTASFLENMKELARQSPRDAAARLGSALKFVAAAAAVVPLAVGAYLMRVAVLTWRSGEFPPPGTRVLRDTVVTTGPGSRRWAVFALLVAVILLLCGTALPLLTWSVVESLLRGGAAPGGV